MKLARKLEGEDRKLENKKARKGGREMREAQGARRRAGGPGPKEAQVAACDRPFILVCRPTSQPKYWANQSGSDGADEEACAARSTRSTRDRRSLDLQTMDTGQALGKLVRLQAEMEGRASQDMRLSNPLRAATHSGNLLIEWILQCPRQTWAIVADSSRMRDSLQPPTNNTSSQ